MGAWVNVTATGGTRSGYLTVWSGDGARPTASTLNYLPGTSVPNLAAVALSSTGDIAVYNGSTGNVDVVVDRVARIGNGDAVAPGSVTSSTPFRALDTRGTVRLAAGASLDVPVIGVGGVPSTASGVALNVTAVTPTTSGWATVHSPAVARPWASSLTWTSGSTRATAVLSNVDNGRIRLHNGAGAPVHLVVDVTGWIAPGSTHQRPTSVTLTTPVRVLDTRGNSPVKHGATFTLSKGAPPLHSPIYSITTTQATGRGYLSMWGTSTSVTNYAPSTTSSSLTTIMARGGEPATLRNDGASVHVVVDLVGWIGPDVWLTGHVRDPDGASISGAKVAKSQPSTIPGHHEYSDVGGTTGADGGWVLHNSSGAGTPLCAVYKTVESLDSTQNFAPACLGGGASVPPTFDFRTGTRALGLDLTMARGGAITSLFSAQPETRMTPYMQLRHVASGRITEVYPSKTSGMRLTANGLEPGEYVVLRRDIVENHQFEWVGGMQAGLMPTTDLLRFGAEKVTVRASEITDLDAYAPNLGGRIRATTSAVTGFYARVYAADGRVMYTRSISSGQPFSQGGLRAGTYYLCTASASEPFDCPTPEDGIGPITVTPGQTSAVTVPVP